MLMILFREQIASLYTVNEAVYLQASNILILVSIGFIFDGMQGYL